MEVEKTNNSDHLVVTIGQQSTKVAEPPQATPRTNTLKRLNFSKPRSRFEEVKQPLSPNNKIDQLQPLINNSYENSNSSTDDDDDDDEWYEKEEEEEEEGGGGKADDSQGKDRKMISRRRRRRRKINKRAVMEWSLFLIIMTCLLCSLTLQSIKYDKKWGLEIWKWCLMVMVVFCGRLVAGWVVGLIVLLIERNFMLREKVLYFVYGLRKSFQNCAWLGLVLIAWMIMFPNVHEHNKMLKKVFRALVAILIGATIWLLKILLVKVLASSFHVATFFDRMQESVFNHYILETLSGPPLDEDDRDQPRRYLQASKSLPAKLRSRDILPQSQQQGPRRIDKEKLKRLSMQSRATAWSVKRLVSLVMSSGLSTISTTVDAFGNADQSEITSEWEARSTAQRIFKNVAKPGAKYIEEEDLLRFLKGEEVSTIFPLFEGSESGKISKSSFRNWVVHAYFERKALAHSLNDTKTAVHQLHKLASAVVIVVITVVSLLVMGLATSKVIFVVTSQLLLVGFMFQNTCKTMFESIIFVFAMHPFDVGDRCVIDNVQMIVEEMNILTTVFLRYDNEKIYYPNSVLLTKPISNFRRSPDMADTIDFSIDVGTPVDHVNALKKAIQNYLESKPKYWSPKHMVLVKEIENVNKMKMCLCVQHTINHQNFGEKSTRRSELVFELKKIFETIGIKYQLLPQEVHLTQFNIN
ncbi:hypothetical protein FEM48_Zijuj06G0202400 [Ziziphus jujuba var. spinosa]|uniref:Mechanosensitive ion channel protein n=1 Tax=Ziziphus jujuba var. spinosa TaxID=714518 RepID=A0A978VBD9_ZIZJJ|nr:hypothetical protein FEM48_Zijuj06G0202400 [Ziziphus jujuba var. spinosa]